MAGGNDGYSMVVPYNTGAYYDLRPTVSTAPGSVLHINNEIGFHPNLPRVHQRSTAIVEGLGTVNPDLSHFEMLRRWWQGDVDGHSPQATGFLGRLCDAVGDPNAAAAGVSLGWGPTPALLAARAVTLSLSPYDSGGYPGPWDYNLRNVWIAGHRAMSHPDRLEANAMITTARKGDASALKFSDVMAAIPAVGTGYPDTQLGHQLAMAARLIRGSIGVRVIHVPFNGNFDTHLDHKAQYADRMTELDAALNAFLAELQRQHLMNRVLVATVSEFGRRATQNANGLDHGTASIGLLAGAIHPGVYGQRPSFTQLDDAGDLVPAVGMGDYYATLATWMRVDPHAVLPGAPTPIPGVVLT